MTDKLNPAAARVLCDEMETLAEKATKGPWKLFSLNGVIGVVAAAMKEVIKWTGFDGSDFPRQREANATFIARCREAVPALISHVRSLADEVERLTREINRRKGNPVTRLHNLCEGLEDVEPYGLEEWNRIDTENADLRKRAELAEAERNALLRVARAVEQARGSGARSQGSTQQLFFNSTDEGVAIQDALAALSAELLAKVKGGEG